MNKKGKWDTMKFLNLRNQIDDSAICKSEKYGTP